MSPVLSWVLIVLVALDCLFLAFVAGGTWKHPPRRRR